jgi:hypothetical protein
MPPTINVEARVSQYVKLRDIIKEKDDAHKAAMAPYREALEGLNNLLLDHLNTIGGDSVTTAAGTCYRNLKETASLEDADIFMRHVIGTEQWDLLERKVNLTAARAFAAENGSLPPGVKISSMQVVGIRRK